MFKYIIYDNVEYNIEYGKWTQWKSSVTLLQHNNYYEKPFIRQSSRLSFKELTFCTQLKTKFNGIKRFPLIFFFLLLKFVVLNLSTNKETYFLIMEVINVIKTMKNRNIYIYKMNWDAISTFPKKGKETRIITLLAANSTKQRPLKLFFNNFFYYFSNKTATTSTTKTFND